MADLLGRSEEQKTDKPGVVVVHGVGLGQEVADTVVVDGQTGQAVGVVDGHEHSVVVVLPISVQCACGKQLICLCINLKQTDKALKIKVVPGRLTYRESMKRAKTDIPGVVVVHGKGLGQVGQPVGVVVSSLGEVVIVVVVDVIVANFFGG